MLKLTPEQVAQLEALEAETETKMAAHREAGAQARQEAKATRQAHNRALNDILTEEQQQQLRTYRMTQREQRRAAMKSVDWEGMRAELKTYRETHIEPVLREQRAKLERKLSKDDRAAVAAIREEMAAIRAERRAIREEAIEQTDAPQEEATGKPARRPGRRGKGAVAPVLDVELRDAAAELAAKYADQINALFAEIEPQRAQWKEEQAAIRAKYMPEEARPKAAPRAPIGEEKIEQRNIEFLLMPLDK
ncbi:MAG: hypothetical protein D6772_07270 [Bacteroidetes bacterium]|nr:MAG: hypothetical protein D6772_07270 [Bacteroidota bacterium]